VRVRDKGSQAVGIEQPPMSKHDLVIVYNQHQQQSKSKALVREVGRVSKIEKEN
jgi:hypothetical protein